MRLQKITATEVVVPARAGAINSASLERPLHKLGAKGRAAWTQQFDVLPKLVRQQRIDRVLLAMPATTRRRRREILAQLEPLGVRVQSLPSLPDLIAGKAQISELCDVEVGDLLGRDPVDGSGYVTGQMRPKAWEGVQHVPAAPRDRAARLGGCLILSARCSEHATATIARPLAMRSAVGASAAGRADENRSRAYPLLTRSGRDRAVRQLSC